MSFIRVRYRAIAGRLIAGLVLLALVTGANPHPTLATFHAEREAQEHCPSDLVVWLDPPTRTYYYRGQARYGATKGGSYVCRTEADHVGMRRSRSGR